MFINSLFFSHVERELDRALAEKQKLQMEIEDHIAAQDEIERRVAKLKHEALQRAQDMKVQSS